MNHKDDIPLPFPPDEQQVLLMTGILEEGNYAIASPGTDYFEACEHLAKGHYLSMHHCPMAQGVYQFSVTAKGREAIQ